MSIRMTRTRITRTATPISQPTPPSAPAATRSVKVASRRRSLPLIVRILAIAPPVFFSVRMIPLVVPADTFYGNSGRRLPVSGYVRNANRCLSDSRTGVCPMVSSFRRRHRALVEHFAPPPEDLFRLLEQREHRPRDGLEKAHLLHLRFPERAADPLAHPGASLPVDHRPGDLVAQ